MKRAINDGEPFHANRRGIVQTSEHCEKPVFTYSELLKNRRVGLSFKQIGKKLGIDCSKEEVLTVYNVLSEGLEGELPSVSEVKAPTRVSPPTPLWTLFDSELDLIANHALPIKQDCLIGRPELSIVNQLGEHAGLMLDTYLSVSKVIHERLEFTLSNAPEKSRVAQIAGMTNNLAVKLLHKAFEVERYVAESALELTEYRGGPEPLCQCKSPKVLRFKWKDLPIPYPSLFWGCVNFKPQEALLHDKAIPYKDSLYTAIVKKQDSITDRDAIALSSKLIEAIDFWAKAQKENDDLSSDFQAATLYYGIEGQSSFKSSKSVIAMLKKMSLFLEELTKKRKEDSTSDNED